VFNVFGQEDIKLPVVFLKNKAIILIFSCILSSYFRKDNLLLKSC
jgi:hypothetical protein